ncbi:MAG: AI-2E family transporter [Acidobacteria bacterium]|nr:AI-2E family transporter [Acidobacteriota bacterium]
MYRSVLIVLAIAVGALVLYKLEGVALLLVLAMFFAYLINPLVGITERVLRAVRIPPRLSRGPAIGIVYVIVSVVAWSGAVLLLPTVSQQFGDAVARVPAYSQSLRAWEGGWERSYERLRLPVEMRRRIDQSLVDAGDRAVEAVQESLVAGFGVMSYLPWLVLIPVLSFFLLKDVESLRQSTLDALPERFRGRGYRLFGELNTTLAAYIRAQLIACLLVGSICGVGFAMLGVPYAVLLGVLAGVLEFIPLVGPLLIAVIAGIIAALHAPMLALWSSGFLAIVRVIEDYVIYPRLMGHGIHLHPLAVIIAVLAGVELGGIAGIFLAIPVVAALSVAWRHGLVWLDEGQRTIRV